MISLSQQPPFNVGANLLLLIGVIFILCRDSPSSYRNDASWAIIEQIDLQFFIFFFIFAFLHTVAFGISLSVFFNAFYLLIASPLKKCIFLQKFFCIFFN